MMKKIYFLILIAMIIPMLAGGQSNLWIKQLGIIPMQQWNPSPDNRQPVRFAKDFDFDSFAEKNLIYPTQARDYAISGSVVIGFEVACDGTVRKVKVLQSLGYGCDEAAVLLIQNMPRLHPARFEGKPVSSNARLEIVFSRE